MEVRARQDEDPVSFDFIHPDPRFVRYPLNLRCTTGRSVHDDWLVEIRKYAADTSQFSKEHCTMVHFVLKSSEFCFYTVALQEHADDDLQVDGPGETDTEAEPGDDPVPAPVRVQQQKAAAAPTPVAKPLAPSAAPPKTEEEDTAQIAKKIKDLIALKGAAKSAVKEEVPPPPPPEPRKESLVPTQDPVLQRSDSVDSLKKDGNSTRSASQGSLSGK